MDSKGFISDDALPPPSYESIAYSGPPQDDGARSESATRHLQDHVASLPGVIRASRQQARTAQQKLDDALLADHIAPAISEFLADLGAGARGGVAATLTVVPGGAVPPGAELSGLEEMRRRGELGRVRRVGLDDNKGEKKKKKKKAGGGGEDDNSGASPSFTFASTPSSSPPYSESGADLLWWRDEAMARRLAACLQPEKKAPGKKSQQRQTERTSAVQAAVEKELPPGKQQKRGWGLGKWKSGRSSSPKAGGGGGGGGGRQDQAQAQEQEQDGAQMTVEAQEVAFRVENDLGILESLRGWAIVVTVDVY